MEGSSSTPMSMETTRHQRKSTITPTWLGKRLSPNAWPARCLSAPPDPSPVRARESTNNGIPGTALPGDVPGNFYSALNQPAGQSDPFLPSGDPWFGHLPTPPALPATTPNDCTPKTFGLKSSVGCRSPAPAERVRRCPRRTRSHLLMFPTDKRRGWSMSPLTSTNDARLDRFTGLPMAGP